MAGVLALTLLVATPAAAAEPSAGQKTWLVHEKVMVLPICQLALLQGVGPRVAESGFGLIADYPWSAQYEKVRLKAR